MLHTILLSDESLQALRLAAMARANELHFKCGSAGATEAEMTLLQALCELQIAQSQ